VLGAALAQPHWTLAKLIYLPMVIAGGALFFLAISIAGCALCFWTVESTEVVNIFTYGGTTMLQYPLTIYQEWMQKFFVYILPMAFINYFPALYFLEKPDSFHLPPLAPFLSPMVCVVVFLLSLRVWEFGVAHYTSTGS
jgi:ABC-2 type transport system permease protein